MEPFSAMIGDSMALCQVSGRRQTLDRMRFTLAVGALVCFVATAGCSPQRRQRPGTAIVTGTVKYQGQPVTGGTLTFVSTKDPLDVATCKIRSTGTFAVADAPIGEAKVTIDTESTKPELGDRYIKLPAKYLQAATTDLTRTIEPGENKIDFDLN